MKRVLSLILAITIMSTIIFVPTITHAATSGTCGDNLTWTLDDNGTLTISGIGKMYDYPSTIPTPWYNIRDKIYNITINSGITSIGNNAFCSCNKLMKVTISNSVASIGDYAFYECKSLMDITIPNSVTSIGDCAFSYCSNIESIVLPNSITSIGYSVFMGCEKLADIIIPNSVTNIGEWAFRSCNSLISIIIPGSVTSVDNYAFYACKNLRKIVLSYGVTKIGSRAFEDCERLRYVFIPDSVKYIGSGAFFSISRLFSSSLHVYYSGSIEEFEETIGSSSKIFGTMDGKLNATIHYGSGKSYTPVEVNTPRPSSAPENKNYGATQFGGRTSGTVGTKEKDVRANLKKSAEDFNKAALNYTAAVSKSVKSQGGTDDDVETFAKKLETEYNNQHGKRILFAVEPNANVKKAAFEGYARYLNQMIEEGMSLNKIDLSDNAVMIDYKLTREILSKIRGQKLSYTYKGYKINVNTSAISNSYFGTMEVVDSKGNKITATIVSDVNQTTEDLQNFANQLKEVAQDVNKKALRAVVSDLVNLTGLGDLGKLIARDGLKEYKPLKNLGYGDVAKNIKKCYSGYEAVKDILNCTDIKNLDSIIDNPKKLSKKLADLGGYEDSITNAAVNAAQEKLINAIYNLMYSAYDYEAYIEGEEPSFVDNVKDFFKKASSYVSALFQCPVDFTVYNENGEMIGYVDNGAVYYNDDIYIETSGDVKKLYVPVGMKVDIRMTGTDVGELNYMIEEVIYDQPTGRLNYYGLPLSEGTEYTQSLNTVEFNNDTSVLPIMTEDGYVSANEYISSEDTTAYVIVDTEADNGGTVLGGGDYAKGDSVELTAVPGDDRYIFNGLYIRNELVSTDNIYRFTAIENTNIRAEFTRMYAADNAYDIQMSDKFDDFYAYIYKDSDGTQGIVLAPFGENPADSMQIYVTSYAADGSVINSDVPYLATINENGIYAFENIDLGSAARVVIMDENGIEIALSEYDKGKDESYSEIVVYGQYSDRLKAYAHEESEILDVEIDILDYSIDPDNITGYLAKYDEDGILLNCDVLTGIVVDNKILFSEDFYDNCKFMLWDSSQSPITEPVTSDMLKN